MAEEGLPQLVTILSLPSELIEHCMGICPAPTLISLCRVSQFFNTLATRCLYRQISLCTVGALIRCCRTLAARPNAAISVRSIALSYAVPSSRYTQNLYELIRKAFFATREVVHLKLSTPDPRVLHVIERCIFPSLSSFHCQLTLSPALVEFLNNHPTLTSVEVSPFENTRLVKEQLPVLDLPALEHFAGNAQIVAKLGMHAKVRAVFISWNAIDQQPQLALRALQSDTLRALGCRRRGWNLDLFDLISTHLPDILWLNMANLLAVDSHPTKDYVSSIRTYLTRFKRLQRLGLHCVDTWQMGDIQCVLENDFQTVRSWGEACPSLQQVILPHSGAMTWYRVIDDLWIPDPRDQRGAAWLYRIVMRREYPSWNRVLQCLRSRVSLRSLDNSRFERALVLAEHLLEVPLASVSAVVTRTGETDETQRTARDNEDAPPQCGSLPGCDPLGASARDWRTGNGHRAFVELCQLAVISYTAMAA